MDTVRCVSVLAAVYLRVMTEQSMLLQDGEESARPACIEIAEDGEESARPACIRIEATVCTSRVLALLLLLVASVSIGAVMVYVLHNGAIVGLHSVIGQSSASPRAALCCSSCASLCPTIDASPCRTALLVLYSTALAVRN